MTEKNFLLNYYQLRLNSFAKDKNKKIAKSFGRAWQEYSETLSDPKDGELSVRNTVRPHYFVPVLLLLLSK